MPSVAGVATLEAVADDALGEAIVDAWLACAPPALAAAYLAEEDAPRRP